MGEVWPTTHAAEMCLHSLLAQGLETEMNRAHSFSRAMEFRAQLRNLPFFAEF